MITDPDPRLCLTAESRDACCQTATVEDPERGRARAPACGARCAAAGPCARVWQAPAAGKGEGEAEGDAVSLEVFIALLHHHHTRPEPL